MEGKSGRFPTRVQAGGRKAGYLSRRDFKHFAKMPCEAMLLKIRAPGETLSVSKVLQILGFLPHFPGFLRLSPRPTVIPGCAHRGASPPKPSPPPPRSGIHPYVALGGRPEPPFPAWSPALTAAPSPRPLAGAQGLLTYPEVGPGSTPGAGFRWRSGAARRGRCCPGTPPRGPGGRRGPAPSGRGLRRSRDAGRGGAATETHGGIARHRAGQLRSARLRCWLRSRHTVLSRRRVQSPSHGWREEAGPGRGGA